MKVTVSRPTTRPARPRVAAVVGLTLLEMLRTHDRPSEVLQDEDTSVTLPRRLGLSDVVDRQIRRYKEEARKGGRMTDEELADLVRLVIRRPDSEEVFFEAGRVIAHDGSRALRWRRLLPPPAAYALGRRAVRRRLRRLFGRPIGGFAAGPFTLEGRSLILIESDPGGDACHLLTSFCQAVLELYVGEQVRVVHSMCQSRADSHCRWTVLAEERVQQAESVGDFMLNPEPG